MSRLTCLSDSPIFRSGLTRRAITALFVLITISITTSAQVTGLWEVTRVTVGEETMTPVAKWFLLTGDMKAHSGNGGIENSRGTYVYDYNRSEVLFLDQYGEMDAYGPFVVKTEGEQVTWTREEEGMMVYVYLKKVSEKPLAPWDKIVGNWLLTGTEENKPQEAKSVFIRWDRRYVARNGIFGDNRFGVWQIHGHRPELRLISDQGDANDSAWDISFDGDQMTWVERDTIEPEILTFKKNN